MRAWSKIRDLWRGLKQGRPGHRFQDRYDHAARAPAKQHLGWRIVKIIGGILALLIGLVEIVFPGPAILFLFIGGALLATESRLVARAMDWSELRVRGIWRVVRRKWHSASGGMRATVVLAAACGGLTSGYLMYRVVAD